MWGFLRLRVYPTERLHRIEAFMCGQHVGQAYSLVCTGLGDHDAASDLFHTCIASPSYGEAVEQSCNLCTRITDSDHCLQNVVRHDVRGRLS